MSAREDEAKKADVLKVRNALFEAGDGMTFDAFMQGSIMAQAKIATETASSPDEAAQSLMYYYNIAIQALPTYWADRSNLSHEGERDG